jgi:hypothetical protein
VPSFANLRETRRISRSPQVRDIALPNCVPYAFCGGRIVSFFLLSRRSPRLKLFASGKTDGLTDSHILLFFLDIFKKPE